MIWRRDITPLFSSSALRYSKEVMELEKQDIDFITSVGPGEMENYLIHRLSHGYADGQSCSETHVYRDIPDSLLVIDFENDKRGVISMLVGDCSFHLLLDTKVAKLP